MKMFTTLSDYATCASNHIRTTACTRRDRARCSVRPTIELCESRRMMTVSFADAVLYTLPAADDSAAVVTADFNGDGKLDVAALNKEATSIYVALGNGDGTLGTILTTTVDATAQDLVTGDFNGDGKPDLALAVAGAFGPTGDDEIHVLINNGDGTFAAPIVSSAAGVGVVDIAAGDLTGDGKADVVVGDSLLENNLGVLLNAGAGQLGPIVTYDVGHATRDLALGDLNNDGKIDIAAALGDGFGATLLNDGSGAFAPAAVFQLAAFTETRVEGVALGNVVGNANVDLIVTSENGEGFVTLAGNGDGTFGAIVQQDDGTRDEALAADFDGDGDTDVVTTDGLFGEMEAYTRGDDAGFTRTSFHFVGRHTYFIATGDFNNDGKADVVTTGERETAQGGDGFLGIFVNTSTGDVPPPPPPAEAEEEPTTDLAANALVVKHAGASAIGGATKGAATVTITNANVGKFSGPANVGFYASTDGAVDGGDTLLASVDKTFSLGSGKHKSVKAAFTFPDVADGNYTILAKVTAIGSPADIEPANDVTAAAGAVTIAAPFVDLAGRSLVVQFKGDSAVGNLTKGTANATFANDGNVAHGGVVTVKFYASTDDVVDGGDTLVQTVTKTLAIKSGAAKSIKSAFTFPNVVDGAYRILASVEPVTGETLTNNNAAVSATPIAIAAPFVDLSGAFTKAPAAWKIGKAASATLAVRNDGNMPAVGDLVVRYSISADATLDGDDVALGEVGKALKLKSDGVVSRKASLTLPDGTTAGNYFLIASINPAGTIVEADVANNTAFSTTAIAIA